MSERSALQTDREKITPIASDSVKPLLPVKAKPMGFYALLYALKRPVLRASTRVRQRVLFDGDGDGDAVSLTAAFAGLGAGVGSAAKTLD